MVDKIPYKDTKYFSKLVLDYLSHDEKLKPFVNYFPKIENFGKQISEKKDHYVDRSELVRVLKNQNAKFSLLKRSKQNIDLLKLDSTFTVTTGHQLCLFTGPLYFIYKIISTLDLCDKLTVTYPDNNFVPIFWMASEDHDFLEVNHIHLFGKKVEWDTKQSGAVGKINLGAFKSVLADLKLLLGSHKNTDKLISLFERAYLNHDNLADSTRFLVNELFGKYGLVIIDGDNIDLKRQFIPNMKKDILEFGFVDTIKKCSNRLAKNYKQQAFIRNTNFFKLSAGKRELIKEGVTEKDIDENPEKFSPNVLLRPLYQEVILPNIAYVGGESEVAYWMQLKTAFIQEGIPFPILVLRNSALLISEKQHNTFESLGFKLSDLFLSEDKLNMKYVLRHSNSQISLEDVKIDFDLLYQKLESKTIDFSMKNSIKANHKKQLNFFSNLEEKLIRIEKKNNEAAISKIAKIKKLLFPNNILQERYNNFIPYYLDGGDDFIKILRKNFDSLQPNFIILTLNN